MAEPENGSSPLAEALARVGDRWTLLVVEALPGRSRLWALPRPWGSGGRPASAIRRVGSAPVTGGGLGPCLSLVALCRSAGPRSAAAPAAQDVPCDVRGQHHG